MNYFRSIAIALVLLCMLISVPAHATPERLSPVPFSHTVKMPYGITLTELAATPIAEAFALHGAFTRASSWLDHRQNLASASNASPALAARRGAIFANQLYNFHRSKIFRSSDSENLYINVEVTITPIAKFDEERLMAIRPTSRAYLYEAIYTAEENYLKKFSSSIYKDKHKIYLHDLDPKRQFLFNDIAKRLTVLKAYRKLVPQYSQGLWNNPKQILASVNKLLEKAPEEPILLHAKGSALFQLKNTVEAIRYFNDAIDLEPDFVVALHDRGTAYVRASLPDMALVDYDKAISLAPENPHLYISHGSADLVRKDFRSMCEYYSKGCALGFCDEFNWGVARGLCQQ
ncbi:tetratricopeptide repeat protein [Halodesulfovibrio spirochaetisodalis]|uniref:Uncharacterized protein n=1 Tax=Halodesulfovibrio spirochaetisodalis TaxID=1560234 RepID=A0A1B7XBX3_9BACT|nr:hypothetical protein [Halodesulfovibrio spirochaetisodalis]OBQ50264.1 hypothetical protein SP90_10130 [Halodesulfovibrio spirochaetisodalis]